MQCEICESDNHRLRCIGNGVWACLPCAYRSEPPKERSVMVREMIHFKTIGNVSKRRVQELERRVMLPYDKPDGGYYTGRRMENGKISETRQVDYRP